MKHTVEELDKGQLSLMWNFLRFGSVKSNVKVLKRLLDDLRQAMIQMTAGQEQYKKSYEVPSSDVGTIVNSIVIEAMCLYLSGDLDKLEAMEGNNDKEDKK